VRAVLGINVDGHPSACLITDDGRAVATSEQHQTLGALDPDRGVPSRAISTCLDSLGVAPDELVAVVLCGALATDCLLEIPRARIHTIDRHLAHAASAFYPSGFDHASILVVDRGGSSRVRASAYRARGGAPERVFAIEDRDDAPESSLGAMVELFAARLGGGDVAGLMDLATRGGDRLRDDLARHCELTASGYQLSPDAQRFSDPLGPAASADAAWAVGDVLRRVATHLAMQLVERTGARKLCVAGDAAVHGLAQLDPRAHPWLDQVYVPPAPGEVGTAVGAALFGWCELLGAPPPCELETAFRGRAYRDDEVIAALVPYRASHQLGPRRPEQILDDVADLLAGGALVAWFDGGAALGDPIGSRCVLASPRCLPLASKIGARLGRPSFRAMTAVVLVEEAEDYFALSGHSPFAHRTARVVPHRTREIPLVVRGDGTSRVQTVDRWRAPRLDDLLRRFRRRGGIPVLASVPLCEAGGPAVETPSDALRLWDRAGFDAIFLQGHLLVRSSEPSYTGDES
jgi:carbamoyltransferase